MKGWKNRRAARLAKNAALEEERQKIREIRAAHARGLPEPEAPKPLETIQTTETPELPEDAAIGNTPDFDPSKDLELVHKGGGRWAVEQDGNVLVGPFTGKGAKAKADEAKKTLLESVTSEGESETAETATQDSDVGTTDTEASGD